MDILKEGHQIVPETTHDSIRQPVGSTPADDKACHMHSCQRPTPQQSFLSPSTIKSLAATGFKQAFHNPAADELSRGLFILYKDVAECRRLHPFAQTSYQQALLLGEINYGPVPTPGYVNHT